MKKLLLGLILFSIPAFGKYYIPATKYPVLDEARVLSKQGLEASAEAAVDIRNETGVQVGAMIVDTLDGEDIADVANKIARQWALGEKGINNGLLVLIAIKEHKSRIEVGYGLEGFVTDAQSKRILMESRHFFKEGDYNEGLYLILRNLQKVIVANKAELAKPKPKSEPMSRETMVWLAIAFLGLIGMGVFFIRRQMKKDAEEEKNRKKYFSQQIDAMQEMRDRDYVSDGYIPVPVVYPSESESKPKHSHSYSSDDDDSDSGSSSGSSSGGGFGDSDWGGGGGSFGGGGASDSW